MEFLLDQPIALTESELDVHDRRVAEYFLYHLGHPLPPNLGDA